MAINIYTDGGARGNPGPAACAFIVYGESAGSVRESRQKGSLPRVAARGKYLGEKTNNEAEYQGVIEALAWLLENLADLGDLSQISFFLDSELVVNQLNGLFKVKEPRLRDLITQIRLLEGQLGKINLTYTSVPRSQNFEADALVNEIMDKSAG